VDTSTLACEVIAIASCADPRHLIRLRIKVKGTDGRGNRFQQTAFTHNVSARGARITQVPPFLYPAATIDVEYRGRRSRFRVVWVGGLANDEVGLLSLEPSRCIWGTPLPGQLIRSVKMASPAAMASLHSTIAPRPAVLAQTPSRPGPTEEVTQEKRKRVGYFCKESDCRKTRAFHLIGDGQVLWDIWPQKIECPVSGQRYEYWKDDIRSAGYV
jgi:hypothetical protein